MTKVHTPKGIAENKIRCDLYLTSPVDQVLIDYLAPFTRSRRANHELRRLLYLGLQVANGDLSIPLMSNAAAHPSGAYGIPQNDGMPMAITQEASDPLVATFGMPAID